MFNKESFAEKLLRNRDGGAVGVIAPSCFSFSGYNDALSTGFVDAIWPVPGLLPRFGSGGVINPQLQEHEKIITMGDVVIQGLLRMTETWSRISHIQYQFELYHYFGDPAMQIYTKMPESFDVSDVSPFEPGVDSLVVKVNNCPGALVTLSAVTELIAMDTVSNGIAVLRFNPFSISDTLILTVSHINYRPWQKKISGPVAVFSNKTVIGEWKVFPNPVRDVLFLEIPEKWQGDLFNISVFSYDGKMVNRQTVQKQSVIKINTQMFPKGVYQIRIANQKQRLIAKAGFVKE
mgnify:CR=1 FL=1